MISLIPAPHLMLSVEISYEEFFFFLNCIVNWLNLSVKPRHNVLKQKNEPEDERGTPQKVHFLVSI